MRFTQLDGGLIGFDRASGANMLVANERTRHLRRIAPRSLQVGLLTPCNLSCSFCYRDTNAPSLLDRAFLVALLQKSARWGVLEVAFGGGEPLMFKGFANMIDELHDTTDLGLNFTTNGVFLTPELMNRLRGKIAEIRLSLYPDNDWRGTLARVSTDSIGVNLLVTRHNVADVGALTRELIGLGVRNVLLLGYKGTDRSMLLGDDDLARLEDELAMLEGFPMLLDICLYPRLPRLPHLFRRNDCGAGDDMLAITADRAVQACSFADRRIPFETFEDLRAIYGILRRTAPHANVGGCTRGLFEAHAHERVVSGRVLPILRDEPVSRTFAWKAHASSNSGPYTLIARFVDVARAKKFEQVLDDVYQAHLDYVVEQEVTERAETMYKPTPPLVALGERYGFEWPSEDSRGCFVWEGDGFGDREEADALEIERLGTNVIVHLSYGQGVAEAGIEHLCALFEGSSFIATERPFRVVATPKTEKAAEQLDALLEDDERESEYVSFDSARTEHECELDVCWYRVEVNFATVPRRIGFSSNIGGYTSASRLVVAMSSVRDVDFQVRGGRVPLKVDQRIAAGVLPDEPLGDDTVTPSRAPTLVSPGSVPPESAQSSARRFELVDDTSNKFWEIEVSGTTLTTRYGRIGAKAQSTVKTFDSREAATKEANKLIAEKTRKGYIEKG